MVNVSTQNLLDSLAAFVRELSNEGKKLQTGLITGSLVSVCREGGEGKKKHNSAFRIVHLVSHYLTFDSSGCFPCCWMLFFFFF